MRFISMCAALLLLVGCAHQQQNPEDPLGWARFDCQSMKNRPDLQPEFDQAKEVCSNSAQAQSMSARGQMRGRSLVDAVANDINANQIAVASGKACMAERGYKFEKQSEFEARCPVPPPAPAPASPAKPKAKMSSPVASVPAQTKAPAPQ
jgi:hypothetical protein